MLFVPPKSSTNHLFCKFSCSNLYSQLRTNRSNEDGPRWYLLEDGIRNELSSSPVGSPNITNSNHWAAVLPPWLLQHREESRTTTISDLVITLCLFFITRYCSSIKYYFPCIYVLSSLSGISSCQSSMQVELNIEFRLSSTESFLRENPRFLFGLSIFFLPL